MVLVARGGVPSKYSPWKDPVTHKQNNNSLKKYYMDVGRHHALNHEVRWFLKSPSGAADRGKLFVSKDKESTGTSMNQS